MIDKIKQIRAEQEATKRAAEASNNNETSRRGSLNDQPRSRRASIFDQSGPPSTNVEPPRRPSILSRRSSIIDMSRRQSIANQPRRLSIIGVERPPFVTVPTSIDFDSENLANPKQSRRVSIFGVEKTAFVTTNVKNDSGYSETTTGTMSNGGTPPFSKSDAVVHRNAKLKHMPDIDSVA